MNQKLVDRLIKLGRETIDSNVVDATETVSDFPLHDTPKYLNDNLHEIVIGIMCMSYVFYNRAISQLSEMMGPIEKLLGGVTTDDIDDLIGNPSAKYYTLCVLRVLLEALAEEQSALPVETP